MILVILMVGADGHCVCQARETIRRKPEVQRGLQALQEAGETSGFVVELEVLGTEMG